MEKNLKCGSRRISNFEIASEFHWVYIPYEYFFLFCMFRNFNTCKTISFFFLICFILSQNLPDASLDITSMFFFISTHSLYFKSGETSLKMNIRYKNEYTLRSGRIKKNRKNITVYHAVAFLRDDNWQKVRAAVILFSVFLEHPDSFTTPLHKSDVTDENKSKVLL